MHLELGESSITAYIVKDEGKLTLEERSKAVPAYVFFPQRLIEHLTVQWQTGSVHARARSQSRAVPGGGAVGDGGSTQADFSYFMNTLNKTGPGERTGRSAGFQ
ncbi:hypothetical protein AOLI_G00109890 [Acnodon oligacanthus]